MHKRTGCTVVEAEWAGNNGLLNRLQSKDLEAVSIAIPFLSDQQLDSVFKSAANLMGAWREMVLRDCVFTTAPASLRRLTKSEERRTLHGT